MHTASSYLAPFPRSEGVIPNSILALIVATLAIGCSRHSLATHLRRDFPRRLQSLVFCKNYCVAGAPLRSKIFSEAHIRFRRCRSKGRSVANLEREEICSSVTPDKGLQSSLENDQIQHSTVTV